MLSRYQLGRPHQHISLQIHQSGCIYHIANILVSPRFSIICEVFVFIPHSGLPSSHPVIKNMNDYNLILLNVYLKADCFGKQLATSMSLWKVTSIGFMPSEMASVKCMLQKVWPGSQSNSMMIWISTANCLFTLHILETIPVTLSTFCC